MTEFIAALPMYDWPESGAETDAEWGAIRARLLSAGVPAPEHLTRGMDMHAVWRQPNLILAQTCWGPLELGLVPDVTVIGQPNYSAFEGGAGELYSSAIVMRRGSLPSPLRGGSVREAERGGGGDEVLRPARTQHSSPPPPGPSGHPPRKGEGKAAAIPLDLIRGTRFAFNSDDSMSGMLAIARDLEALGEPPDRIFGGLIKTGAHRASIAAVAEGRADVCTIDCRSWALAQRFEPATQALQVVGWTGMRKGLPYIAAPAMVERFPGLATALR